VVFWKASENCKSKQASGCGFCDGCGKIVSQNKQGGVKTKVSFS
jgi:hypothetical protein